MKLECLNDWFLSVSQYAKAHGITRQGVQKAIVEGRLVAGRIGEQWVIPKGEKIRRGKP